MGDNVDQVSKFLTRQTMGTTMSTAAAPFIHFAPDDPKMKLLGFKTSSPKGNDISPENKQVFLNSSQVSKRFFFQLVKGGQLCSPWLDQILTSNKGRNFVANLQKKTLCNSNVDLVKDNEYTKFGLILSIHY